MLPGQPRTVVIPFAIWRVIGFFATPQRFETEIFVPRVGMELSDSERSIPEARYRSGQVRAATRFHFQGLTVHRTCLGVRKNARRGRLASSADRIPRGDA